MIKNAIWLFFVALIVLVLFLPSYTQMQDMVQKNMDLEAQIYKLKKQNVRLKEERRLLEEDPVYLEKVGREKMGLIKENEVIFKILPGNKER